MILINIDEPSLKLFILWKWDIDKNTKEKKDLKVNRLSVKHLNGFFICLLLCLSNDCLLQMFK